MNKNLNNVTVLIPALNEEKNIAKVINIIKNIKIVDEIIVIDNNSTDNTAQIAKELGVKTIFCEKRGKGYSMEEGIKNTSNDIIVFVDGDICNYDTEFINKLVDPIFNRNCEFVKSSFTREGGRVTELTAKPLLKLLFPELSKFDQPLSGIIAGKKSFFESLKFEKDYGIDIGILIDAYLLNIKMEQVYIGEIKNDSQDWKDLVAMSEQVTRTILKKKKYL